MKRILGIGVVGVLFALCGCRTTEEILRDYNSEFQRGIYQRGASETSELAASGGGDELLWHLLAGSAYRLSGEHEQAFRHMEAADHCYGANDTKGVFSRGASSSWAMMVNDTVFAYDGGGVDRVFTCLYKAIDFLDQNNPSQARIDLNRAGQYQRNWLFDRRKEIEAARKRFDSDAQRYANSQRTTSSTASGSNAIVSSALSDATLRNQFIKNCGFDPTCDGDVEAIASTKGYMNPYELHVEGVFRWLNGDSDRNELRDAASCLPRSSMAKRDASERRANKFPRDQVWVYIEDGLCPERREWRCDLPLFLIPGARDYLPYVAMAFPTLQKRSVASDYWRVEDKTPEIICDVDSLVRTEYDIYMKGAVTREISRTVIRAGMEIALGILAEKHKSQNDYWAYKLGQVAVAVWAASCTRADTRSWVSLPKRVFAARIDRPESGLVTVRAAGETVTISLPRGNSMVFLRKPGSTSPTIVKKYTAK